MYIYDINKYIRYTYIEIYLVFAVLIVVVFFRNGVSNDGYKIYNAIYYLTAEK